MMIDLTYVIAAAITLVLAVLTYILYPYISQKISVEKMDEIKRWVKYAVEAAEMIYVGSGRGEEKKAYVIDFLKKQGFTIDAEVINVMIESAVLELKNLLKD